jgi:hypothetical protein
MNRSTVLLTVLCVMLLAGTTLANSISNGSFEDDGLNNGWVTSVSDWTLVPPVGAPPTEYRAGLFYNFDGFTATAGNEFAILTHRGKSSLPQTMVSFPIVLGPLDHYLEFDYVYVTKNVPGDTTHIDPFTVTMWSGTQKLETWTISDVDDPDLALGSISSVPFGPSGSLPGTYDTGWQTFNVNIQEYMGSTVDFEFRIADSAQQGGGSGFFLDRVTVAPEPGTFLLFGVGALGLMLYGRRKVRRKK